MADDRNCLLISAAKGIHLEELKQQIEAFFHESQLELKLCIPFADGRIISKLHALGSISSTNYAAEGTILTVLLPASEAEPFMKYKIEE